MKTFASLFVGLASLIATACQENVAPPTHVAQFSIQSVPTQATYDIKVALPDDYFTSNDPRAVIYVLDGEENLNLVADECKKLSAMYGTQGVLVVSIGYGRSRDMDYTPTKTSNSMGGAPEFLQFIKQELVPHMEMEFRADTSRACRVILGHSFGGLFGAYAFVADNDLFGNYLLLSPSLWFDNEVTLRMETSMRSTLANRQQLVYMGIGENENVGKMHAPFEAFYEILNANYGKALLMKNLEANLGHMGSRNPNIRKGLDFYFQHR